MSNPDHLLVRRFIAAPHSPLAVDTNAVARDLRMVLRGWDPASRALTMSFLALDDHVQGNGAVHGGIVSTMLDLALAFAVLGELEPPRVAVTASLNLHFERAVLPGELHLVSRVDRLGGRLAFATAELTPAGHPEVLARGTAVLAVV